MIYKKTRVAVIGCGQISFAHFKELALIKEAEIVAVCDKVGLLAEDTADRFGIPKWYTDYLTMIEEASPDVVHITVPPAIQKKIAIDCIKKGCHIYIEKPFCVDLKETQKVLKEAEKKNVLVCVGFSQVYDNAVMRLNRFIKSGQIGKVVHIETIYCNDLGGSFSKLFLQNKNHWIHNLPGKLFQNIISHALIQVAPFFTPSIEKSLCLTQDYSKNGVLEDELRMMIESEGVTAYITFTSSIRPGNQFVRIYGTKGTAEVDLTNHIFRRHTSSKLPGPLARIQNAFGGGRQLLKEGFVNVYGFITGKDRFFTGMGNLFSKFYEAINKKEKEPPVPYNDVLVVAELIDKISEHCGSKEK